MFKFRPALTSEAKPLIGIYAESGAGKTYSALLLAKGFAGDMSKVGMIETESGRGEVFADDPLVGGFNVLSLRDDFSPKAYGAAIDAAGKADLRALIVDSASHEWDSSTGVLGMASENQAAGKKGPIVWQIPKISHQRDFILKLMQTPVPLVIVCMRAKYPMKEIIQNGKKEWSRSEVLEPKQADDILFEMMVHGWVDQNHNFHVTKYTKDAFREVFIDNQRISVETGQRLAAWAAGKPAQQKVDHTDALRNLLQENNIPEADFLKAGSKTALSLSEVLDLAKATAWILKNKQFGSQENPTEPINDDFTATLDAENTTVPDVIVMTFAQVSEKINKADAPDILEMAGDYINAVMNVDHRLELRELYSAKLASLQQAGK